MILDFVDFKQRQNEKLKYRESLVRRIVDHYRQNDRSGDHSFYLEHVRHGFPVHVLEGILERLEQGLTDGDSQVQ